MLKIHAKNLGAVAILCLQGRIVRGETEALRRAVLSQSGIHALILDLAQVNTIDAGGLGALLELREQTQTKGIDFKLMNVTTLVSWVLKITRLNTVFEVTSRVEILAEVTSQAEIWAGVSGRPTSVLELARCA